MMLVCLVVWPEKSHSLLIGIYSYDFSGLRSERIGMDKWYKVVWSDESI